MDTFIRIFGCLKDRGDKILSFQKLQKEKKPKHPPDNFVIREATFPLGYHPPALKSDSQQELSSSNIQSRVKWLVKILRGIC